VQVLNLDQPFADEHDLGDLRSSTHPGVADELGIQYASLAGNASNEEKLAAGLQDIVVICTCCNFCAKECFNTKGSGT
jgi:hypothetical protein